MFPWKWNSTSFLDRKFVCFLWENRFWCRLNSAVKMFYKMHKNFIISGKMTRIFKYYVNIYISKNYFFQLHLYLNFWLWNYARPSNLFSPQSAAHRISELNFFLYLRISGVSLGGRVLVGFTLTIDPFLTSIFSCSNLESGNRGERTWNSSKRENTKEENNTETSL